VRAPLRCLQRVDLPVCLLRCCLQMGGHVAIAEAPLGRRIRERKAVFAGRKFLYFLAAIAFFHDGMACPSVELAAVFAHEKTVISFFDDCTNHFNHILSLKE
jgi:MFS-type transporter involved in bile tolerance (Atg22 family)